MKRHAGTLVLCSLLGLLPGGAAVGGSKHAGWSSTIAAPGTPDETRVVQYDSGQPGPTVLVVGGMHGNEYAGFRAAVQVSTWRVSRGRLIVIPWANTRGIRKTARAVPGLGDLNRQFPPSGEHPLPVGLWSVVEREKPTWIVDLHEAWVQAEPGSGGGCSCDRAALAESVLWSPGQHGTENRTMARTMAAAAGGERPFATLQMGVPSMLTQAAASRWGTRAVLVETWWGHHTLPERIAQHTRAVEALLHAVEMQPQVPKAVGKSFAGRLEHGSPAHDRLALEPVVRIADRDHQWATAEMTAMLIEVARWNRATWRGWDRLQVADIAGPDGGPLSPHESHQSGLDVDLQYLRVNHHEERPGSRWFTEDFVEGGKATPNFDAERNARLLAYIVRHYDVAAIYVDQVLIDAMRATDVARQDSERADVFDKLFHYPHHQDHFHVRLACPPGHPACTNAPGQGCVGCTQTCRHSPRPIR